MNNSVVIHGNAPATSALPPISVVVPAYNCARYLPDALDSILAQQYPNLEIIVVDDGSSDGTAEVAKTYGEAVKVICQNNKGPAAARNRGVQASRGQYLAFLDGDDVWLPGKLHAQIACFLAQSDLGIVYGGFRRWNANADGSYPAKDLLPTTRAATALAPDRQRWIYHELLLDSVVCIITAMIPRTLFDALGGFDESLRSGEDYDFWLRASRLVQACRLPQEVALYRINPSSTTFIPRETNNEQAVLLRTVEKHGLVSPDGISISKAQLNARLFQLSFSHGYMHYWHGTPAIAFAAFHRSLQYERKRLTVYLYWLASYLRSKLGR